MKKLIILLTLFIALCSQAQNRLFGNGFFSIRNNKFGWFGTSGTDSVGYVDSTKVKLFKPILPGTYTTAGLPSPGAFPGYLVYNSDSLKLMWSDGTQWNIIGPSGGGGGGGVTDHGALTGLSDDDHSQYALLAGRSSGQTLIGGTGTTDDLILQSTSGVGATGGTIQFKVGNNGGTTALAINNDASIENTSYFGTTYKFRLGDFIIQPFAVNNGFLTYNGYHNGTNWTRPVSGYMSGFQFFIGQTLFYSANNGSGTFTPIVSMKTDYSGYIALGGTAISTSSGNYSGATMVVNPTLTAWGGLTSSFSGIRNNSGLLRVVKADNSALSDIEIAGRAYDESTYNGSNRAVSEDAFRDQVELMKDKPYSTLHQYFINTTDATPTNMTASYGGTMNIPNNSVGIIKVHLVANGGGTGAATHKVQGVKYYTFNKNGSTLTIDAADVIVADKIGSSISGASWQLTSSSNQPVIQVTGASGVNINWAAAIEILLTL